MARRLITYPDLRHIADPHDPTTVEEIAFPTESLEMYLRKWVARSTATKNLLFFGPPGSGKTRAAFVLAQARSKNTRSNDIEYLECKTGTADLIVERFANAGSTLDKAMNPLWEQIVILDEVDNLKPKEQQQLGTILDANDHAFLLVSSQLNKVHAGIRNRCYETEWNIAEFYKCKPRLFALCHNIIGTRVSEKLLAQQVYSNAGWRQMLRNIDSLSAESLGS